MKPKHTPIDIDPLALAQTVLGPQHIVRTEYVRTGETSSWARHRRIAALHERELAAYKVLYARMVEAIERYLEREVLHGPLRKADRDLDWILVSPEQLEAIRRIIGDHHEAYVAGMLSPDLLKPEEHARLVAAGIIPPGHAAVDPAGLAVPRQASVEQAYQYGRKLAAQPSPRAREAYRHNEAEDEPPEPLSRTEREAIHWAEEHAAEYVRGLSKRISADVTSQVVAAATKHVRDEHQKYDVLPGESPLTQEDIRAVVIDNLEKRRAWRTIVTDLGDHSGDWARDLGRIAATEKTRAMQEGYARGLTKDRDPKKTYVAKIPSPDACKHCVALHLEGGPGSKPRVFPLSELVANGNNVGLKAADWKPVVGPVHPWCQCELVHVPEGWVFDDTNQMVPEMLTRAERVPRELQKSAAAFAEQRAHYGDSVPEKGISVRVGDPATREAVDEVIARTPAKVFTRRTGITLITTEAVREGSWLEENDFAYWSGNEIRISQTLPAKKVRRVLEHEIGHALNVHLFHSLGGGVEGVYRWHELLWNVTQNEGFVSLYARLSALENAAEVTRWYLYYRARLMRDFPRQFAFLHRAYAGLL